MKIFHVILATVAIQLLSGCAVTEQTTDDVGRQLQQGLTGGGHIVSDKPMSDSFGSEYH